MTVWKVTSRKLLSPAHMKQLMEQGQTEELIFKSKKNKPFKARLVINGIRTEFAYSNGDEDGDESAKYMSLDRKEIRVRVESAQPGIVDLTVESLDMPRFFQKINFGLCSTREAECMGIVVAADYAKFYIPDYKEKTVRIQVNSEEFSNYILRETKPRDKEMQYFMNIAWEKLGGFRAFEMYYMQLRTTTEGASVAAAMYIDPGEESEGRIVFNQAEGRKAIIAMIKAMLRTGDDLNPAEESYWRDQISYSAYFYDDSNTTYPYYFTDPDTGFKFTVNRPSVVVTINADKARYTIKGVVDEAQNVRSAAHEIIGYQR